MALNVRRWAIAVVSATVVLLAGGGPAAAHGGGADIEVVEAVGGADASVSVRLAITYDDDGEPAEGAIVDVVPVGPDGSSLPAVRLERQAEPGSYAATFDVAEPGRWTLEVTSAFPPGSVEVPVVVGVDDTGSSTATNLVVAAVFGTVGGVLGLWVSQRRRMRRQESGGD